MYKEIRGIIGSLDVSTLPLERKEILQELIAYIQEKVSGKQEIRLNFICTHNSRRSHLAQVWAQTLAHHFQISQMFCYSGGTEATALYPVVATTLEETGFQIQKLSEENNPVYSMKYSENEHPIIGFSKTFDDVFNPKSNFAAILTCSQADVGCPFIAGAEKRIPITYEDPKVSDGSPNQKEVYSNRSLQIATEMYYVFSQIKK
ncbi:protein-tyrosine-phosphatase [Xanthomarina sp. F1114]|uniref:arsenate-mycothiol transferase ArsC n=1 Tax=Xanthomarina sp. F1114 TaxID=2996019 RepID=UPI00225DDEFC|nr:protein-tyrosine-phosphatase [Xanthomarina sp. F1114]MCX7549110.1 protein-tyrosine-phosphatase [Xanthomarina sp. F1114]